MNINDMIGKAKDLAAQHPDAVRSGLDKVEKLVDDRTGHAHTGMISKAADAVEGTLGVRETGTQQESAQTQTPAQQEPAQPPAQPAGQQAPAQPKTPAQEPAQPQTPAQEQQNPAQGHTA